MMISSHPPPKEVYVWVWLPGEVGSVVAGVATREGKGQVFNYICAFIRFRKGH